MSNATPPADRYYIGGAGLPKVQPDHPFPFNSARQFQAQSLEWIHKRADYPPVNALAAPTGGGKTAIIAALAAAADNGAVCTYPTNKLVEEQAAALRATDEFDLSVTHVSGETLTGTGDERSTNLLNIARSASTDVVVTNPDILQAVLQDAYFSPGGRVMEFYSYFDAAVFDEFHYYDPLAASGLLTQINALSNRGTMLDRFGDRKPPRVLLTSATPDKEFVEHIHEDLQIDAQIIRSRLVSLDLDDPAPERAPAPADNLIYQDAGTPETLPARVADHEAGRSPGDLVQPVPDDVDRFRYPMRIDRYDDHIADAFPSIADRLSETILSADRAADADSDPVAAIIFNSAARSNDFQSYLESKREELAALTRKDNGYDTRAAASNDGDFAILNTTSKGEVGLDFDLHRLIVTTPWTASDFVQRIGRAARQSPAVVDLYGLDDPTWPTVQSYSGFLRRIVETLADPETTRAQLRHLAGLRAGRAINQRLDGTTWHPDLQSDFESIEYTDFWQATLRRLDADEVKDGLEATFGGPYIDTSGRRAIQAARAVRWGFDSLRGRSTSVPITYPVGDTAQQTEYDLLRALQHYRLEGRDSQHRLVLVDEPPERLIGYYPGEPFDGDGIDLQQSSTTIETQLTDSFTSIAQAADLREMPIDNDRLQALFQWVPLRSALLPVRVETPGYTITFDLQTGEVADVQQR